MRPRWIDDAAMPTTMLLVLSAALLFWSAAIAYDKYADDTAPDPNATNCAACHGPFNSGAPYVEQQAGGGVWPGDLMTTHEQLMLSGDCDACHATGGRSPVFLNSSRGGNGLMPISCVGCHGRLQDAPAGGTEGAGAGLRRHHIDTGASGCWQSCHNHADADPAAPRPVLAGENVLPEYYANPGIGHAIPASACNDSEDIAGSSDGQDNDGDLLFEGADPDCPCVAGATPGEVSGPGLPPIRVTAHDKVAGRVTIRYGATCCATDNNIHWGLLTEVAGPTYSGSNCSITNSGTFDWVYPDPGSYFFLIVADNGVVEGSYGADSAGSERDEGVCEPRNLIAECN